MYSLASFPEVTQSVCFSYALQYTLRGGGELEKSKKINLAQVDSSSSHKS